MGAFAGVPSGGDRDFLTNCQPRQFALRAADAVYLAASAAAGLPDGESLSPAVPRAGAAGGIRCGFADSHAAVAA
jgi:hypothetical protein